MNERCGQRDGRGARSPIVPRGSGFDIPSVARASSPGAVSACLSTTITRSAGCTLTLITQRHRVGEQQTSGRRERGSWLARAILDPTERVQESSVSVVLMTSSGTSRRPLRHKREDVSGIQQGRQQ